MEHVHAVPWCMYCGYLWNLCTQYHAVCTVDTCGTCTHSTMLYVLWIPVEHVHTVPCCMYCGYLWNMYTQYHAVCTVDTVLGR